MTSRQQFQEMREDHELRREREPTEMTDAELVDQVARKVMGWEWRRLSCGDDSPGQVIPSSVKAWVDQKNMCHGQVFDPISDGRHRDMVLDEAERRGWLYREETLSAIHADRPYQCSIWAEKDISPIICREAGTRGRAVCLAMLAAVGGSDAH